MRKQKLIYITVVSLQQPKAIMLQQPLLVSAFMALNLNLAVLQDPVEV